MHHRVPPSKTGWSSLNVVIFPPVLRLVLDEPITVTTPEIIDQIHEQILEDLRISTKSIAEQLGISRERVGSIVHEDLDKRRLYAKWAPKCLNTNQKRQRCQSSEQVLESFRCDPNEFLSILVTRTQSNNQWSGGIAAYLAPKIPSGKICWKSSLLNFLRSRRYPPH